MRDYRFKAKRVDNGKWVYGANILILAPSGESMSVDVYICATGESVNVTGDDTCLNLAKIEGKFYKVWPETVSQYSNIDDKTGKMICDGDIVNFITPHHTFTNCKISYEHDYARFCAIDIHGYTYPMDVSFEYEIVGNFHDNPELWIGEINDS